MAGPLLRKFVWNIYRCSNLAVVAVISVNPNVNLIWPMPFAREKCMQVILPHGVYKFTFHVLLMFIIDDLWCSSGIDTE